MIHLLAGEEEAVASSWLEEKLNEWVPEACRSLNVHRVEVSKIPLEELSNLLVSFPMGSDYRVVILRDLDKADAQRKKKIPDLLQSLPDTTQVVLWLVPGPSDLKKWGLGKEWDPVFQRAKPVRCGLKKEEKARWLQSRLRKAGTDLSRDAEALLLERSGENLLRLELELDKLSLLGRRVGREDVEALHRDPEENIFAFLDAVGERKAPKALGSLQALLKKGEPPLRVLAALANQIRLFWRIRSLLEEGKSPQEISRVIGLHPYRVSKGMQHSRNFKPHELTRLMDWLVRADLSIKSGKQDADHVIQVLVARLCSV